MPQRIEIYENTKKRCQKLMLLFLALFDSRTKPDLLVSQGSFLLGNNPVGAIMLSVQQSKPRSPIILTAKPS